ncbi:MAG: cobalt-precorrin-5B (C(1))-methyltransferase, partial [Clostridiales bacterium]|nr:cobalt-precorrin-5B (C(1))-methyltransferase [Clostridiales bacterium]
MERKNGLEDYSVIRGKKRMRFGYTTGSCAAAACKGAARMLLGGGNLDRVELMTPKGILLSLELEDVRREKNAVSCGVRKDAGDDPDTTNGILVCARVEKDSSMVGVLVDGGVGVGRVT